MFAPCRRADVAGRQQQDREGAHIGRADRLLVAPMHQISVAGFSSRRSAPMALSCAAGCR
jgi:hypothetical protein